MNDFKNNHIKISRRRAIGLGSATVAAVALGGFGLEPVQAAGLQSLDILKPEIFARSAWADKPPVGQIIPEDDVKFLLVHHTASTNDYSQSEVTNQIRGFYNYHVSDEKGWPDIAYNFFVDKYGGIWEGRQGSLAGPVRGDATGGSQGHAILCSLIGDHSKVPVTDAAKQSLIKILAWQAELYNIDTTPGRTITFTSRGSNKWAVGQKVAARTISGHREMSATSCPGDFAFNILESEIPAAVTKLRLDISDQSQTTSENGVTSTTLVEGSTSTSMAETILNSQAVGDSRSESSSQITPDPKSISIASETDPGNNTALIVGGATAATLLAGTVGYGLQKRRDEKTKEDWIDAHEAQ